MENMSAVGAENFARNYEVHLKHLKLKGLQPKTIDAYARAIRRAGDYFDHALEDLSETDLLDYFTDLSDSHSWSSVKLDLYGLKFYHQHVLKKTWVAPDLVKPPRAQRIPVVASVEEVDRILEATQVRSYKVLLFTLYSLGLRLGEGLRLRPADIDATHMRVHIRNAKGNKDRMVPLPHTTYHVLRDFWARHRNPDLLFPSRVGGAAGARSAKNSLDRGGVQNALRAVIDDCGLKKRSRRIAYAMPTPPT